MIQFNIITCRSTSPTAYIACFLYPAHPASTPKKLSNNLSYYVMYVTYSAYTIGYMSNGGPVNSSDLQNLGRGLEPTQVMCSQEQ